MSAPSGRRQWLRAILRDVFQDVAGDGSVALLPTVHRSLESPGIVVDIDTTTSRGADQSADPDIASSGEYLWRETTYIVRARVEVAQDALTDEMGLAQDRLFDLIERAVIGFMPTASHQLFTGSGYLCRLQAITLPEEYPGGDLGGTVGSIMCLGRIAYTQTII